MGSSTAYNSQMIVDCPRCHEQCGWCADPRHMHGKLRLPGSRKRCDIPAMAPEGDTCPLCAGSMKVMRFIEYGRLEPQTRERECPFSPDGLHHMDTSMEEGPHHCFNCGVNMRPTKEQTDG